MTIFIFRSKKNYKFYETDFFSYEKKFFSYSFRYRFFIRYKKNFEIFFKSKIHKFHADMHNKFFFDN